MLGWERGVTSVVFICKMGFKTVSASGWLYHRGVDARVRLSDEIQAARGPVLMPPPRPVRSAASTDPAERHGDVRLVAYF